MYSPFDEEGPASPTNVGSTMHTERQSLLAANNGSAASMPSR